MNNQSTTKPSAFAHLSGPGGSMGVSSSSSTFSTAYYEPETLLEVKVTNPTKRGDHIDYLISLDTNLPQLPQRVRIWKRYSEFVKLRESLHKETPQAQLPILPPKGLPLIRTMNVDDLEKRRNGLDNFIRGAISHPLINTRSKALIKFLQPPSTSSSSMLSDSPSEFSE